MIRARAGQARNTRNAMGSKPEGKIKKLINLGLKIVGIISIVLTLILSIINLLGLFKPDFRLRAIGNYVNVAIPDALFEDMRSYLEESIPYTSWKGDYFYPYSATTTNLMHFRYIESILEFDIENLGNKSAKDMKLEIPFSGFYSLGNGQVNQFTEIISLGNLNPTNKINVLVWAKTNVSRYDEGKTRVTYDGGWSGINYPRRVGSIWSFLIDNFFYFVIWVLLVFWLLFGKFLMYKVIGFFNKK
ncbi:MAG: hypothetical protein AAB602_00630 [Patescibacteria group bacterium]